MELRATLIVGGACAFLTSAAHAQGYFSFGDIPGLDAEPTIEIDLDAAMLGLVSEAAKGVEGEAAAALEGITNVRVHVYEDIGADINDVLGFVDDASQTLEQQGWRSVIRIREDSEQVRIFMKPAAAGGNAGTVDGLTMMVIDSAREAVFINVAGSIQPAQLGRIAAAIGMNGMFDMVPGVGSRPRGDEDN